MVEKGGKVLPGVWDDMVYMIELFEYSTYGYAWIVCAGFGVLSFKKHILTKGISHLTRIS